MGRKRRKQRRDLRTTLAVPAVVGAWKKDWESPIALACRKCQIREFNQTYAENNVPAYHKPDGTLVVPASAGREGRNKTLKFLNAVDNDGGFGDYTGKSRHS